MSALRLTYLLLAIVGAIWPFWHFVAHFEAGGGFSGLFAAWLANDATRGLSADLFVTGTALTIWIVAEVLVRRNWLALVAIPATFLVGVSLGFPLYLFLRTRPVA